MADKNLSLPQRVVVILRGPTGGMLACLLTASLLGGVAAAHPGAWADASTAGQQPSPAAQEEASTPTTAVAGTTCGVVLVGLAASAEDVHALTRAIQAVRTNCDGEPQAPGLLVALRHLRANLERQGSESGDGNNSGGSPGNAGPGAGSNAGGGSGSNAGGGQSGPGGDGSVSGSSTGGGSTGSGSGSGSEPDAGDGTGSAGSSGQTGAVSGGGNTGSGSGGNQGSGGGAGSSGPAGGGPQSSGRQETPNHR